MSAWSNQQKKSGKRIGLVPTMGFFHKGHLSLIRMTEKCADFVVVSLFVNPAQFGKNEDLGRYPRALAKDTELAREQGVDILFTPESKDIYPPDFQSAVSVNKLGQGLCGKSRPGHFTGVTTVVNKLFNIVKPELAIFGEKDFQQLAIIRRMVLDLNMDINILAHPIVREPDGLAMSSRNTYLSHKDRHAALSLFRGINMAKSMFNQGEDDPKKLTRKIEKYILSHSETSIDYISFVNPLTLEPVSRVDKTTRLIMAVTIAGVVRLLDNSSLG
jgi:pantoate--beta-alanine ligase